MTRAIDAYVADFAGHLRTPPAATRRSVEEVAGHLEDAVAALLAVGHAPADAERIAIERFGAPDVIAARFNAGNGARLLLLDLALRLASLIAMGAIALGAANAVGVPLGAALGAKFVAGAPAGLRLPLASCPALAQAYPRAGDCAAAWSEQSVRDGLGIGLLLTAAGVTAAGAAWLVRRRAIGRAAPARVQAVAARLIPLAFALAAALLLFIGLTRAGSAGAPDHRWLPLAAACLAIAAVQRRILVRIHPAGAV